MIVQLHNITTREHIWQHSVLYHSWDARDYQWCGQHTQLLFGVVKRPFIQGKLHHVVSNIKLWQQCSDHGTRCCQTVQHNYHSHQPISKSADDNQSISWCQPVNPLMTTSKSADDNQSINWCQSVNQLMTTSQSADANQSINWWQHVNQVMPTSQSTDDWEL